MAVLRCVAEHRHVTTSQLERFVFTGHGSADSAARTTRRVLARLHRVGLLRHLSRRIGGVRAGSAATIWQLAPAGARILSDDSGYRTHEPSLRFLDHCLSVADTHLRLLDAADEAGKHATGEPVTSDVLASMTIAVEPTTWRRYTGTGGETRWLQPDLTAIHTTPDYEDRWFIEVDCGSESLPTLLRKCEVYETYRRSGQEQATHGIFPLILWVFYGPKADHRLLRLRSSLQRSTRFTPGLYRFATANTIADALHLGDAL